MKGNYNFIAPFYDQLSTLIYGDAIVNAQRFLVDAIVEKSAILIIGGGTGWILEEISKRHSAGLRVTYVDISRKMIARSKKRYIGNNEVVFLNSDIRHTNLNGTFNIVITPFVLDNFSSPTVKRVFEKIDPHLASNTLWLFTDFQSGDHIQLWQKLLLRSMYRFFRIVSNIEASELPDTDPLFRRYGYEASASKNFYGNFIVSTIYKKSDT